MGLNAGSRQYWIRVGKLILTVSGEWVDFLAKRMVSAKGDAGTKERNKDSSKVRAGQKWDVGF